MFHTSFHVEVHFGDFGCHFRSRMNVIMILRKTTGIRLARWKVSATRNAPQDPHTLVCTDVLSTDKGPVNDAQTLLRRTSRNVEDKLDFHLIFQSI